MDNTSKKILVVIVALLTLSMITPVAAGTTWYVDDSGGSDFTTIQDAVNASVADDTIVVRDGTYNENVDVNKRLTIGSENGSDLTSVIALNSDDHVFEVTADYVNISGFTVNGATGSSWDRVGIYLYSVDHCNIFDNTASSNDYGIYVSYSSNNTLTGNTVSNNDYGITLYYSSNNILTGNTVNSNNYDGILLVTSSDNLIYNNYLNNTKNAYDGGNNDWNISKTSGTNIIGGVHTLVVTTGLIILEWMQMEMNLVIQLIASILTDQIKTSFRL